MPTDRSAMAVRRATLGRGRGGSCRLLPPRSDGRERRRVGGCAVRSLKEERACHPVSFRGAGRHVDDIARRSAAITTAKLHSPHSNVFLTTRPGASPPRNEKTPRFRGVRPSPLPDSNRRPPPYHAIQTAAGGSLRQRFPVSSSHFGSSGGPNLCHPLRPLCSITVPSQSAQNAQFEAPRATLMRG
jgi:hypothetical protein